MKRMLEMLKRSFEIFLLKKTFGELTPIACERQLARTIGAQGIWTPTVAATQDGGT